MARIARLVGVNAPQKTTGRMRSVSEVRVSVSCWHSGTSTLCGVIGIFGNGVKVVTKEYTRFILSGAGITETMMSFSVKQNRSQTLSIADSIISSFPRLGCHAVYD